MPCRRNSPTIFLPRRRQYDGSTQALYSRDPPRYRRRRAADAGARRRACSRCARPSRTRRRASDAGALAGLVEKHARLAGAEEVYVAIAPDLAADRKVQPRFEAHAAGGSLRRARLRRLQGKLGSPHAHVCRGQPRLRGGCLVRTVSIRGIGSGKPFAAQLGGAARQRCRARLSKAGWRKAVSAAIRWRLSRPRARPEVGADRWQLSRADDRTLARQWPLDRQRAADRWQAGPVVGA